MEGSTVRILAVDDYEPFRRFICSTLRKRLKLQIVGEATDGLEAVQKAEALQPDLIVLDIGLPTLNGIEAARRIRKLSPKSKILFVSQESSADVVREALALGALGYVVKARAGSELVAAVGAVLEGRQYISGGLSGHYFTDATDTHVPRLLTQAGSPIAGAEKREMVRNHEVQFYSDDASFLVSLTHFVEATLEEESKVIVVVTEVTPEAVFCQGLQARGVDIAAADEQERFVLLDAAEVLSTFMEDAGPSCERFLSTITPLIRSAEIKHKRVVVFGEGVGVLCAEGRIKAAIELEQLWNELAQTHPVYIRCAYLNDRRTQRGSHMQRYAQSHSAVLAVEA